MFTGIIEAVGSIKRLEQRGGDVRLHVATGDLDLSDVKLGDSIATNGVCLTAVTLTGDGFTADVSRESLKRTALGELSAGSPVNLEKAMQPTSRFGGHIVSGHVDGVGQVVEISPSGRSLIYKVETPVDLSRYIAEKGSITVDGVSLTVNAIEGNIFHLNIVPHTAQETIITHYHPGSRVNLEVDIIARYLERLLTGGQGEKSESQPESRLTESFLAENGFFRKR
ncbi:riboflavin synthase [Parendozoicomonas sp. Alg238-R29]|uniref:riboflavin synthase n=1 Tax=Parendozoicomonas sp. Alg238-R29 TaxID=2993446 RepID=UPI00248DDBD5|nr:riboflavin synthase [Parendozoicomonas sp. Alg238-R29]